VTCCTSAHGTGFGLANLDVSITRSVFDTLANHYPERMGVLYMFDAPFVFW
jgi:CRAL/TRIO domain